MSLSRAEIHKSAVGLEQIAACFHELASASDAVVTAQKKLSKALKESASTKGCPDVAKNALTASAWLLDAVLESDATYARTVEREYESLSTILRRWFKQLGKDERNHDDFVAIRESKIRQAGEAYERRALKRDIAEEYARYIDILNTLGSEISVAQSQHQNETNARQKGAMVSSGACIARLADAAWTRSCDSLRRAAPGVGNVGTARAWCEGGLDSYASLPTEGEAYPVPGDPAFRPPSYRSNSAAPSSPTTPMDYKNRASMPSSDAPDHAQEDRDHLQPGLSMDAGSSGTSEPSVASMEQTSTDVPAAPVEVFEASEMSDSDRRRLSSSPRSFRADTLESNATARPLSPMHRKPSPSPMPYPAPQRYNSQTPSPSTPRRRLPVTPNGMPDYFSSVSPQPLPMPSYDYAGSSRLRPPTPTLAYTKNQSQSKIGRGLRRLSLPSFGGTGNR